MQSNLRTSNAAYKRGNTSTTPFQQIENLAKKRPSSTKLDIEKMYEESLELTAHHKRLMKENGQLKEDYQRVESIKNNRQNLISVVQKIVEEKSKELNGKQTGHFSWLVFKLNSKIYDLRGKIEAKERAIKEITLSRESQIIRQKETEVECLNEIIEFACDEGFMKPGFSAKESPELSNIKQIVWMEQEIKEKQDQIIDAQKIYKQEEKQVRTIMQELAKKKAELKSIKEMESQYNRTQQLYKQEKKKKQQRIAGNKTYLEDLQTQKVQELKKLESLKQRYKVMEQQQNIAIASLEGQLSKLKRQYEYRLKVKQDTVVKFSEQKVQVSKKKQVKRVTLQQVQIIGKNINYTMTLRGVSHKDMGMFFNSQKEEYSIREVCELLKEHPFSMNNDQQTLLVARYVVEDTGDGYFLQDMDTSQSTSIIKSILSKLIGDVKVYESHEAQKYRIRVGKILSKFGKLVLQALQTKESIANSGSNDRQRQNKKMVSKQRLIDALENSLSTLQSEQFWHEQIDFTIFYLFSWSRNLKQLPIDRIFTMIDEPINWPSNL